MDAETRAEIEALRAEIRELKLSRAQRVVRAMKRNKRIVAALMAIGIVIPVSIYALSITKSFTFTAGNPTVASEVNANFDQLFTKVNDLAAYHPPIGTILAWHKSLTGTPGLPASGEWVECNGQTLSDAQSPYNTQVIPNLNGDAAGANSPGQTAKLSMFLRGGLTSGTGQQDAFQGHWHKGVNNAAAFFQSGAAPGVFYAGTTSASGDLAGDPSSDGANGTPRTANETRPVNMSVVWIMKVK
ncbi:MAG: hypothetical protein JNJ69_12825 [Leptospiraceae bacterium]|nr:hypothetical protein [Leptospiraceae bacterium]